MFDNCSVKMLVLALPFVFLYCSIDTLAVQINSNSNYGNFPATENGTCYKRVLYDDATAANISDGVFQTLPGTQLDGIKLGEDRITIIDCCEGFIRDSDTGKCEFHCDEGCFGGNCTGPNECTCEDGWRAESGVCKPVCRRRCGSNSYCYAPDVCTCKFGYDEVDGRCQPVCEHCEHGDCYGHRKCRCHPGYFLNETQHCEPVCEGGCPHGICESPGICSCQEGFHNPRNNLETCVADCPNSCLNGECLSPNVCTCYPGYDSGADGSCIPRCEDECAHGFCAAPGKCECNVGYILSSATKLCVEKPKDYIKPSRYPQNNYSPSNGNNYQPITTVSNVNTYTDRTTFRPQIVGQRFGNEDFNVQPIVHHHPGDQQNTNEPGNRQNTYGPSRPHSPHGVTQAPGLNPNNPYGSRPDSKNPTHQGYQPNQDRVPDRESHRNPLDYQENGEPKLFYPENNQGQTQNPPRRPQATYSTQDPREVGGNNINPNNPNYRPQRPLQPERPNTHGHYDGQTQRPQGPFPSVSSDQDNYRQRPYGSNLNQHTGQTQNPEGVKTNYHRPGSDPYHRPGVNRPPNDPGLELVYGVNIVHDPPESRGSILTFGPNQAHGQALPGSQPQQPEINPWIGGNDGVARTYIFENGQISIIDPFGPGCPIPCVNAVCIGNQCMCNQGYEPDPTNPYSTTCLPTCSNGCINGVCSAPNLCLCKVGYVKEFGVKGSNRCVLAK